MNKARLGEFFYSLDYISLSGISKCGDWKKIKIKIEFEPKTYKISGTLDVIYVDDIYSEKEVNFNSKNSYNVQLFQFK